MSKLNMVKEIQFWTTPKELRRIADKLEKEYNKSTPGDLTPSYHTSHYSIGRGLEYRLVLKIDQTAMGE